MTPACVIQGPSPPSSPDVAAKQAVAGALNAASPPPAAADGADGVRKNAVVAYSTAVAASGSYPPPDVAVSGTVAYGVPTMIYAAAPPVVPVVHAVPYPATAPAPSGREV